MFSNWEICIFVIIIIIFFFISASVSLSLSIVNVHLLVWAGHGRVVSTQALAREFGVQACWREVWELFNFCEKKKKNYDSFFSRLSVSLSLSCSEYISLFQVCLSLTFTAPVLCLSGLCRLPADSLWFRPRFYSIQTTVGCQPTISCFRPLSRAIQPTAGCQPTFFGYAPGIVPSSPQSVASQLCWGGVRTFASTETLSATNVCLATSAIVTFTLSVDIRGTLFRIFWVTAIKYQQWVNSNSVRQD